MSRGLWLPHCAGWPLNDEDLLDGFDPFPDADEFEEYDWFVGEPVTVVIVGKARLGRLDEDLGDSDLGELAERGLGSF